MFDLTDLLDPRYSIRTNPEGKYFAVFRDEFARDDFDRANPDKFRGCRLASFGNLDNAFELPAFVTFSREHLVEMIDRVQNRADAIDLANMLWPMMRLS